MRSNRFPGAPRPELTDRDGAVLVSLNHIALLQGLLDRPGGEARSSHDWACAALPVLRRFHESPSYWCVLKATRTVHASWVARRREGHRMVATLTPRGRGILDRSVAARVRGYGPYRGLQAIGSGGDTR